MNFSQAMHGVIRHGDSWRAEVGADWLQGRSAFGGLQAALGLRAMRDLVPAELALRSLQVTFLAPVPAGQVDIRAACLRKGNTTMHVEAGLYAGDQLLCRLLGVFGSARPSVLDFQPEQPVVVALAAREVPYIPAKMPAFFQHFRMRWLRGDLPFSGGTQREAVVQVSLRDDGPLDATHVVALADFIPPLALGMFTQPTSGSSLTWMLELLRDGYDDLGLDDWRIDATVLAAHDGYTNQSVMLWGPHGEPVALSRQSMVVFG